MAFVDEAQAETVAKLGPRNPYLMESIPAAMSLIIFGMKKGLKRGVPSPVTNPLTSSTIVSIPPMPEAQITPERSLSVASGSSLASFTASSAAICAYWV